MMRFKAKKHSIDSVFTLLLLMVFALFTLMLSAMGSAIYRNGIDHLNENYTSRTAIAYVSEKVRQHDAEGDIFLTQVEEIPAIGFRDEIDGNPFITYVYYYDGALRELFVHADTEPAAANGNRIVELEAFAIQELDAAAQDNRSDGAMEQDDDSGDAAAQAGLPDAETLPDSTTGSINSLLYVTASGRDGSQISVLIHPGHLPCQSRARIQTDF